MFKDMLRVDVEICTFSNNLGKLGNLAQKYRIGNAIQKN